VVKLLLEAPGINVTQADKRGRTPLYMASLKGHNPVVKLLLNAPGINASVADVDGQTPLFVASIGGHVEVVRLLLATPGVTLTLNRPDLYGRTALRVATKVKIRKLLQAAGAT